jgi:hypothetical protein
MPRPVNAKAPDGPGDDLPSDFITPAKTSNAARSSAVHSGNSSIGISTQKGNAPPKVSGKLSVTKYRRQRHNQLASSGKKISASDNGKEERTISAQEKKQIAIKLEKQRVSVEHCSHVLSVLTKNTSGPEFWLREEYKKIRESMEVLRSNPKAFPPVVGDQLPDGSIFTGADIESYTKMPALSTKYIASIAAFAELNFEELPVLQVVSSKMNTELSTTLKKKTSIHFTHLRLRDGSNDVITGRLSMHISHEGNKLSDGDIIRLNRFTPITYTPSGHDNPQRSPAIIIHTYAKVGYASVPHILNEPLRCPDRSMSDQIEAVLTDAAVGEIYFEDDDGDKESEWEPSMEVTCLPSNRFCSVYGVSTVICICDSDPVDKINLEMVREYCYFATTDVAKMSNSWKRNMLYWWYMTNTYNICGKGTRAEPPACLKNAIRKAYPSERADGLFKKYVAGSKTNAAKVKSQNKKKAK